MGKMAVLSCISSALSRARDISLKNPLSDKIKGDASFFQQSYSPNCNPEFAY